MKKFQLLWTSLLVAAFILSACGGGAQTTEGTATLPAVVPTEALPTVPVAAPTEAPTTAPTVAAAPTTAPTAVTATQAVTPTTAVTTTTGGGATGKVIFFSTQFNTVDEGEKFRTILKDGGNYDFTGSDEGPLIDMIKAGSPLDLVGALHGTYPPISDSMMNMIDIADDLGKSREFAQAFLKTGLLGTQDYLYYIPWMQATYIMAATKESLQYLPQGADVNALTWQQFGEWCKNLKDKTGGPKCGLPHGEKGLFHRFLEGYLWPSFTGGMVTEFKSQGAVDMLTWARDELWPNVHPQSISYDFMQEPLQSGEVWVAFDHTARLIDALNAKPNDMVTFPAPAGPKGRGFMPVVAGLGIPKNAPNPDGAKALIDYLTKPETQARVLKELAFFPVVGGVQTTDLPAGVALEATAVDAQANSKDALPALLPIGLGQRGGDFNQVYLNAFDRVVINGEDIQTVLNDEAAKLQALMTETGAPCWAPDPVSEGPCQVK